MPQDKTEQPRDKATQSTSYDCLSQWCQQWFAYLNGVYKALAGRTDSLEKRVTAIEQANTQMHAMTGQLKSSGDALNTAVKSLSK